MAKGEKQFNFCNIICDVILGKTQSSFLPCEKLKLNKAKLNEISKTNPAKATGCVTDIDKGSNF